MPRLCLCVCPAVLGLLEPSVPARAGQRRQDLPGMKSVWVWGEGWIVVGYHRTDRLAARKG